MTPQQQASLDIFAESAVSAERVSSGWLGIGFPAECIIAQWAAETGWSLEKVTGDFNYFGLTAATCPDRPKKFCPTEEELTLAQFVLLPLDERQSVTRRVDLRNGRYRYWLSRWFACFDSIESGIAAYIRVITSPGHRYYAAWAAYSRSYNVDGLIDGIAHGGFATGAGYASLLHQIAHQANVTAAIQAARLKPHVT